VHQQAGNPYTSWQKRNSGDDATKKGSQSNLKLTGQTPQALVGHETDQRYSHGSGSFPTIKSGGIQTNYRLQNTLNSNRNKFFQQQYWDDHLTGNQSERSLHGLRGYFGIAQQESQQFDPTSFFMVGNRKVPPSFRHQSHGQSIGSGRLPYDGILPSISQENEDDLEEGYRYKYSSSSRGSGDQNTSELIGRYAKYYRTQEQGAKRKASTSAGLRSVPSPEQQPNDTNNELLSRYLKHSAKKQVRAGSIHVPKYTGDYDPNVYATGKLLSNEKAPPIPYSASKEGSSQEEVKDLLFNKQDAAAEQKYRLEKATFPTSLSNSKNDGTTLPEKGKYQLMYTKRKKMVVASTSDRENDPSMLVKGGDDVTTGTTEEKEQEVAEPLISEPNETALDQSIFSPIPRKAPIKKARKPSIPKVLPKIETKQTDKKTDTAKNRRKSIKPVDIKRENKKVEAREAPPGDIETEVERDRYDETGAEDLQIQSLNDEDWQDVGENCKKDDNEGQQDVANEKNVEEAEKVEEKEDPLAALIPLRAKVDSLQLSSMTGFLPITPVTFSWFPMSQQHKEEFRKMNEQSKVPPSMRPFRNKNNK